VGPSGRSAPHDPGWDRRQDGHHDDHELLGAARASRIITGKSPW
jgi:hypothetical protein